MTRTAPLTPILLISFLYSLGTAVLWNGLGFIAKETYGFSESANLALAIYNGGVYAIAAFASGPITRRLAGRITPRGIIAWVLIVQVLLCPLIMLSPSTLLLFVLTGSMSILAAFFWPIIEAYVSAGRDDHHMRSAIGWWNIVWMTALGIGLIAMSPLLAAGKANYAIAALGPINLLCVLILFLGIPARVAEHRHHQPQHQPPAHYARLLASSRALLPTSYALIGALSPIMPYLLDSLDAPLAWQTSLVATWMFARVIGIGLLWAFPFWHGRWSIILLGTLLLLGGFAGTVLARSIATAVTGLAIFGFGQAVIYYAAMYYVMAVGEADVDAAATHEGLIGLGYAAGPAAALGGVALGGGGWIVVASWGIPAMAIWPAIRPYLKSIQEDEASRPS